VLFAAFLYLQFGIVIFWQKNIGAKAARKIYEFTTIDGITSNSSFEMRMTMATPGASVSKILLLRQINRN